MKKNAMIDLFKITDAQVKALKPLKFGPPVTHVYNPLEYARRAYDAYLRKYGGKPREVVLIGMNPGPWGMAQTGIPFGVTGPNPVITTLLCIGHLPQMKISMLEARSCRSRRVL